jgi:ribonuclease E
MPDLVASAIAPPDALEPAGPPGPVVVPIEIGETPRPLPPAPVFELEPTGPTEGPPDEDDIDEIGVTEPGEPAEVAEGGDEGPARRSRRGRRGGRRRRSSRSAGETASAEATLSTGEDPAGESAQTASLPEAVAAAPEPRAPVDVTRPPVAAEAPAARPDPAAPPARDPD